MSDLSIYLADLRSNLREASGLSTKAKRKPHGGGAMQRILMDAVKALESAGVFKGNTRPRFSSPEWSGGGAVAMANIPLVSKAAKQKVAEVMSGLGYRALKSGGYDGPYGFRMKRGRVIYTISFSDSAGIRGPIGVIGTASEL